MAIKKYWNFADEASVPAEFSEIEGGSGTVSINSDHLRIDAGGTGTGDYAAAAFTTALASNKLTIIYGECKMSGVCGAWVPNLVGLIDSSGTPAAMTAANRDAGLRIWQEYQMSSGADSFDRIACKFKNPSATNYAWIASTSSWDSGAYNTRTHYDEGSYYRFVIIYDGTTSPARARSLVYGYTEEDTNGDERGWNINYDSSWVDFDTGATDIDPFDNDIYVIFGDPTNNETKSAQVIFDFRRIMIGEIDTSNVEEFSFTNKGTTAFPMDYELFMYLNPMPEDQTLWVSRDYDGWYQGGDDSDSPIITRGSEDWVKDAHCFYDGTTYWLFYQIRGNADSRSDIWVSSVTDILNGSWGSATEISTASASEPKHEFPWVTKYGGTWYMFYGVEESPIDWEIQYKTTTQTNPTSGWSAATTRLTAGAAGKFDDGGVSNPFLVWHSGTFTGGTWYMFYGGQDGSGNWKGGLAKSTTGITGTYTRVDVDGVLLIESFNTVLDGGHTDATQVTVDSTASLTAGDLIYIADGSFPIEVLSVDSGTTFTPQIEITASDNDVCRSISRHKVVPRFARQINGYWVIYVTAFGLPPIVGGCEEVVSIYVATTTDDDLADCTFRQLRVGDSAIDFVIPPVSCIERSNENIGTIWEELEPVSGISVDTANITVATPQTNASSPQTFDHTCGANVDALIVVVTIYDASDTDGVVSGVKYNNVAFDSPAATLYYDALCDGHCSIWLLPNPITGDSYTVEVSFGGTVTDFEAAAIGIEGTAGTFDKDSNGTPNTGTTGNLTIAWDTVATETIVFSCSLDDQGDAGKVHPQSTEIYNVDVTDIVSAQYEIRGSSGSQTQTIVDDDGDEDWVIVGAAFKETAGANEYYQSTDGVLTPVGTIIKSGRKVLSGVSTLTGSISKSTTKTFTGSLTWAGVLVKQAQKALTGSTTASGILSTTKVTLLAISGSVTAVGALIRKTRKTFVGSVTAVGTLASSTARSLIGTGSLTPAGSLVKKASKILSGSFTPSGVLATIKAATKAIGGILTPAGALVKQTSKSFVGSVTTVGTLIKQTVKSFVGSVTAVGSLATQKITGGYYQVVGGVLTMSGIVVKQTNKIFTGSVTTAGTLVKRTIKAFTGSITAAGSLVSQRSAFQVISGAVTMAGALVRQTSKQTAGVVIMAGSITRRISKSISGVLTTVGTLVRQIIGLPVPAIRIYAIEAEDRVYAIEAETRIYSIESEDRIYPIQG